MRRFYSLLFYIITPLIVLRLWWKSLKNPAYSARWSERFGFYNAPYKQNVIWFHAVSVGESESLFPLIAIIKLHHPTTPLLITTTTPTGSARVKSVLGESVAHVYLPYDLPDVVERFFRVFKPKIAVILETEIWPNLYRACSDKKIPLYLVNACLSEKSVRGYQKISSLVIPTLHAVTKIATQTDDDKFNFIKIGANANHIENLGNIKFDVRVEESVLFQGKALKKTHFENRFVFLAASTHEGEEEVLLKCYKTIKEKIPNLILVIAPRHPERFNHVAIIAKKAQLNCVTHTSRKVCESAVDVFLIDTLGELKSFYASADVAFVGGSFVPVGGHNLLEPAAVGVPILVGAEVKNIALVVEKLLSAQAVIQCESVAELQTKIVELYHQPQLRNKLISNAKHVVAQNQGATQRIYHLLNLESVT
jgi:3-deoxy-D-manno-octulosonic-acid transferase